MGDHLFISADQWAGDYALKLADALQEAGFSVWMEDHTDLSEEHRRAVRQAVADCAAFIVLVTPAAQESERMLEEVMAALHGDKPVFPLLLAGRSWSLLEGIEHLDVRSGQLPPPDFYDRLGRHAPRRPSYISDEHTLLEEEASPAPSPAPRRRSLMDWLNEREAEEPEQEQGETAEEKETDTTPPLFPRPGRSRAFVPPEVAPPPAPRPTPLAPAAPSAPEKSFWADGATRGLEGGLAPETGEREEVYFTLYHPDEAAAGRWYTLLTYAHVESVLKQVQEDAKRFIPEMGEQQREVRGKKPARLARGTELRFVPEAEGVEFNPPSLSLHWNEDMERAGFRFRASADLIGEPCFGEMSIYVGPLEIACLRFAIHVIDPASVKEGRPSKTHVVTARQYRHIFASYSHRDTPIVQTCVAAAKAVGDTVLIDLETLRAGEVWDKALERMIEQADVFQLFWSENAKNSKYVRKEWTYALEHSHGKGTGEAPGAGFIRPVYWQKPLPTPPRKLKHLHFKYQPDLIRPSGLMPLSDAGGGKTPSTPEG
jgi:hypothetical protein